MKIYKKIYADAKLCEKAISEIFTSVVATGILNVGNKGSVGVSLKIYETRFCFVCSHFAANTDQLEKRNSDFRNTKQFLKFQDDKSANSIDLEQHDTIFWFGDLNYRVDAISLNDTLKYISLNLFDELVKFDQLTNERRNMRVFDSYLEGKLNFRPTFKFVMKSDLYEKQVEILNSQNLAENDLIGKVKLPSWTDRVLWKSSEKVY